jgi:guanosine-3',5'-bis(diphosphate) 3'-pyrophosphohydrolase
MDKSITKRFTDLDWQKRTLIGAITALPIKDKESIFKAISFAEQKHEGQFRTDESRSKYIIHPIRVAKILIEEAKVTDPAILIAGLLHDIIEDCNVSVAEIKKLFGNETADIVASLSKNLFTSKEEYWLHFEDAPTNVKLVKASDRLDNLQGLADYGVTKTWPKDRIEGYLAETEKYILPIAKDAAPSLSKKLEEVMSFIKAGL